MDTKPSSEEVEWMLLVTDTEISIAAAALAEIDDESSETGNNDDEVDGGAEGTVGYLLKSCLHRTCSLTL